MTARVEGCYPRKIDQLDKWQEPTSCEAVMSFPCFLSYLRGFMPSEWMELERVLAPFRKKGADFSGFYDDPKYMDEFKKLRTMMYENCVLHHPKFEDAAHPEESDCPYEMFIDASDYAWAAVLTQRLEPHGVPKIISIKGKAFDATQQRWSAMERELYALWQGVVQHESLIKGFKRLCYIDHKVVRHREGLDPRRSEYSLRRAFTCAMGKSACEAFGHPGRPGPEAHQRHVRRKD